eukprot:CAMPEP_0119016352 /NCGR_PEP_ID=MMETSP1176-20130426/12370_1 /TAXON_ID=265551 /ORGANISM="Synedropsis recta cf, Strain CCMP1620" /LENGTH=508 /DNA_ID=CAMNT_0006969727 /DNA_START=83 /DNA_END=1609 /DNA_ORIENTATION=+
MPANSKSFSPAQPDGHPTACQLQLIGNPGYHNVICQAAPEGYYSTAVNKDDGYIYYGEIKDGELVPGDTKVGDADPEDKGIAMYQTESADVAEKKCEANDYCKWKIDNNGMSGHSPPGDEYDNLIIPIQFADHSDRDMKLKQIEKDIFNDDHISVKDYFETMSGGTLTWTNTFAKTITLSKSESECADDVSGTSTKIHECLKEALQKVAEDQGVFETDYDGITFLHSGYGAENGNKDAFQTYIDDRIWSHSWAIESDEYTGRYALMSAWYGTHNGRYMHAGTAIHEIGQMLGAPTLYGPEPGNGLGYYDAMSNPYGFDGDLHHPGSMSAYTRMLLEWADVVEITDNGAYTIEANSISNKVYKISKGFPTDQYYLIENRMNKGYDKGLSGPGLAIYHIDGKANGKPGYPGDGVYPKNHYRVALIQADGRFDLEMEEDQGDNGDLFYAGSVNGFSPTGPLVNGESTGAEHPNTKAFGATGLQDTGLTITNISVPGETMTFTVEFGAISQS